MAAPSETYVDPSIAGNSGTGTIGDPYGDLQYAFDTMTRDATNGDRVNVKAGTAEVMSGTLNLAPYGTPSSNAPLIIQGYTAAAGDGGIGVIDMNAGAYPFRGNTNYLSYVDLEFKSSSATFIDLDATGSYALRCIFHDNSGTAVDNHGTSGAGIWGCTFYDCDIGCSSGHTMYCRFYQGAVRDFTRCIQQETWGGWPIAFNTFVVDGATRAIHTQYYSQIFNNSIFSNGGTGEGIYVAQFRNNIWNNVIEGFSGTGGMGIEFVSTTAEQNLITNNSLYNNATNLDTYEKTYLEDSNETLGSTPFTDGANGDLTPLDVGSVIGGGLTSVFGNGSQNTNFNRGAVQEAAGGGGNTYSPLGILL